MNPAGLLTYLPFAPDLPRQASPVAQIRNEASENHSSGSVGGILTLFPSPDSYAPQNYYFFPTQPLPDRKYSLILRVTTDHGKHIQQNKNMETEYYMIQSGERRGPFGIETLPSMGLTPDTLVWRQGLSDWTKASELNELDHILNTGTHFTGQYPHYSSEPYFAMFGQQRIGPSTPADLAATGLTPETPVWRQGMAEWAPASTQPELMAAINARRTTVPPNQPPYGPNSYPNFGQPQGAYEPKSYGQPGYRGYMPRTNWLPWAIAGTIIGFIFSCIGAIFGIIGIIQANKANDAFAAGNDIAGEQANNSAKTMSIIALTFGGVGLVTTVIGTIAGFFSIF